MKKKNKIGILCFWDFPEGMAPTTRVLAYSKGLLANGVKVEIISSKRIYKDEVKENNIKKSGNVEGIKYNYPHFFNSVGRNNKLVRGIDELLSRYKIIKHIFKSNIQEKFDCIFLSFDDLYTLKTYTTLLKLVNTLLALIADEYPIPIRDFNKSGVSPEYILKYKKTL